MRWSVPLITCLALALGAVPAGAAARPVSSVGLRECHTAVDATARYAIFRSEMRAVRGSVRMAVRFSLLLRLDGADDFTKVSAPSLGEWISSAPGVDIFRYTKQVTNLMAPASYRARVSFRWYDATGHIVRHETRRTATCEQPDQRANLLIDDVRAEAVEQPGLARYRVTLRNDGRAAAGAFDMALTVDGVAQAPVSIAGLGSADRQTFSFVARRCRTGGSLKVVVDPDNRVDEVDERDDERSLTCPTMKA